MVELLHPSGNEQRLPGTFVELGDLEGCISDLLVAELLVGRQIPKEAAERGPFRDAASARVDMLLSFCRKVSANADSGFKVDTATFSLDAARVALFLRGAGMEIG
jgi:hypothetical protein